MAEVQETIANPGAPDSRYLNQRSDIISCLKQLRDQRADLTLRVDGATETYSCKLLDVSERDFLIEDIAPRSGFAAIREAKKFSISARTEGTFVYIEETRVKKWDQERGIPFFHLALPNKLLYQQRRHSARFRLPLRVSASGASITMFDAQGVVGKVLDISAGGCRAEFQLPSAWAVKADEQLDNCAITIPQLLEIHSEAVVRHFHENKHSQTLVCGIELTKMHVTDRRRLEHFIQTIAKSLATA